jgi:tetratricopeptide (TPR) repeat protein/nucleoside phosphorylase
VAVASFVVEKNPDIIILTALTLEYQAVIKVDAGARSGSSWEGETFDGLPIAFREFEGRNGLALRVAVAQPGDMGAVAALNVLAPLVQKFRPRVVAMSGVCAGKPGKTALGDVVAAERLYFHDTGKQRHDKTQQDLETCSLRKDWKIALEHFDFTARFGSEAWWQARPRPQEWQELWVLTKLLQGVVDPSQDPECATACPQWELVIDALWKSGEVKPATRKLTAKGKRRIEAVLIKHRNQFPDLSPVGTLMPFKVHVAPMGSGSKVIEDPAIWPFVSEHMRKTLALEMEAAALGALVLARAHLPGRLDALVMKGVMDFADHGRDDHFKEYAARASAECLIAFLRERADDPREQATSVSPVERVSADPAEQRQQPITDDRQGDREHHGGEAGDRSDELVRVASKDTLPARTPNSRANGFFVGRIKELEAIAAALLSMDGLRQPGVIVAIQGMPGAGKSYLADHFAHKYRSRFPGGYHVLALDPTSALGVETVGGRLAKLVGVTSWGSPRAWDELRLRLMSPATLVHIENVDDDATADPIVELAQRLTGCALIISGRSRAFGKPPMFQRVELPHLDKSTALQLLEGDFLYQAQLEGSPRTLPGPPEARDRLVRALGYLPLALHLAAGHLVAGRSVDGFLDLLRKDGFALESADIDDPVRLAGRARAVINATFELSLGLLRTRLGARASAGLLGFAIMGYAPSSGIGRSLGAAMAGLGETDFEALMVEATRLSLASGTADTRWSVHPLLAELLRLKVHDGAWLSRMTEWFVARLPKTQNQRWGEIHSEGAALECWLELVPEKEMMHVERMGSTFAVLAGPFPAWLRFCERLCATQPEPEVLSNALWTLCNVAHQAGSSSRAREAAEAKRDLDQERGDERGQALAWGMLGDILQVRGDLDKALEIYQEKVLPVCERLDDADMRASTLGKVADILQIRGDLDEALRIHQEEELPVYERLGDVRARAGTLGKMADILKARGDLDGALRIHQEEQLPVYQRLGDVHAQAVVLNQMADILRVRGDLDVARRIYQEEVLPVCERLGDVRGRAVILAKMAEILQARGGLDEALRILRDEVIPVCEHLGDVRLRAKVLSQVAEILEARGDLDGALRIYTEEVLPVCERIGDVLGRAVTLHSVAKILQGRGDLDGALRIYREEVLPALESHGNVLARAATLGKVADILQQRGDLDGALRIRRDEMLPVFEHVGDVRGRVVTLGKVADILQVRGDLDGALHIYQEEVLPVCERLGDLRGRAAAFGRVADILFARGDLEGALRIRQRDVIPVFESLGDVRGRAVTLAKVADILQARNDLDGALRIRQEVLPVFERLGDVRERAATVSKIADILQDRGDLNEALRIRQQEVLPIFERLADRRELLVAQSNLARALLARGAATDQLEARRLFHLALQAAEAMGLPEADQIRGLLRAYGF